MTQLYYGSGCDSYCFSELLHCCQKSLLKAASSPVPAPCLLSCPPPVGDVTSGAWPSPRSGCQLALHENNLFVVGGYSKVRCQHRGWLALHIHM
jgi:hypothetical protein